MFTALTLYKWAERTGLIILMFICVAFGIHKIVLYEQQIGYERAVAEYTKKQLESEQAARARERDLNNQITEVRNAAARRNQEMEKLADALNSANRKLHDTTANLRNELSTNSVDAIRNTADAALTVFDRCAEEYTRMAENATEHASDVLTLMQAWPHESD